MTDILERLTVSLADRYRIERELGAGGMATVYLAHDVRHDRKVALKVLKPELSAILGAERFLAEIRLTANLQHPHILPLHDSGAADGVVFYVMPYVEGESLRDRLAREKQLPVADAVRIACEVADALAYAHTQAVIHRDIKPENILLYGGHALVADFGIALAASRSDGATRMTETGMSLGTPAYMSPEQAMGEREITPRADIYALGATLYEMLSGEPPFGGPTAQAIIARVMTEEPRALTLHRHTIPPHVEAAVRTALEKLPADRFATAAEFAHALATPGAAVMSPGGAGIRGARTAWSRARLAAVIGTVALAAAGLGATIHAAVAARRPPAPAPLARFALAFDAASRPVDAGGSPVAFAPDGSRIAYVGTDSAGSRNLYLRALDSMEPIIVAGTGGAWLPFFSPDGGRLGFVTPGRLRSTAIAGGSVATVSQVPDTAFIQGAAWLDGDTVVFSRSGILWKVPASGGLPDTLAVPDSAHAMAYRWPQPLPGGKHVLATAVSSEGGPRLIAVSLRDGAVTDLGQAGMDGRWVDAGFVLFARSDSNLVAAPFDPRRLRVTAPPQPIGAVAFGTAFAAKIGVARSGAIAQFQPSGSDAWAGEADLVVVSRGGAVQPLPGLPPARYVGPRFSPDGRRLAVVLSYPATSSSFWRGDIWVYDLASETNTRLTFDSLNIVPSWTPDGRAIAFTKAGRSGAAADQDMLLRIAADGSGELDTLGRGAQLSEAQFTPDGRTLLYRRTGGGSIQDIWMARLDSLAGARALRVTPFAERSLALSSDGRWLAYVSDETGSPEVYVRALAGSGGHLRVSTGGGAEPRWARGGRELFYRNGDTMLVVPVEPGATFRGGRPRALFTGEFQRSPWTPRYDVAPDGQSFIMVRERAPASTRRYEIRVLLNWFDQPAVRQAARGGR